MSVLYRWGSPLPAIDGAVINPDTTPVFNNQWLELNIGLEFTPRNPTVREYALLVSEFVRQYSIENPEIEVRYIEVTESSPQLKLHCISHTGSVGRIAIPPVVAVIIAAIIAVLAAVLPYIIPITIATAVILLAVALYKRIAPPTYQCPICGEEFASYETLVAHMQYEHPGAPVPEKTPDILSWLGPVLLAGIAVTAIVVLVPRIRGGL
jgi:hypothetical protein